MKVAEIMPSAVRDAKELGFVGDVEARLLRMAKRSAAVTHDAGNRRFEDYVLNVEDGKVLNVSMF